MNPRAGLSGVARVGLRLSLGTLRQQVLFTRRFLGLRCDLEHVRAPGEPAVEVVMRPRSDSFLGFAQELNDARGATWLEVYVRQRMLRSGVRTLYVAADDADRPIYAQWLVRPPDLATLDRFSPGRYPRLADDEALVEGAYTFARFRGMGVMSSGMVQLVEMARESGARSVITFVAEDNVPSLRGCARIGFSLDHLRVNRRRLGRRTSVVLPPDARASAAWQAATATRRTQPSGR